MSILLNLTGIATLLLGLQLFTPGIVHATEEASFSINMPSNIYWFTPDFQSSQQRVGNQCNHKDYEPPDKGGPDGTRGSGTR